MDKQEAVSKDDLAVKKEKIAEGLKKLKERTIKYDNLQQQLDAAADRQISTTDADSRSIIIVKSIVEVAYNIHNAVDDKHKLLSFKTPVHKASQTRYTAQRVPGCRRHQ